MLPALILAAGDSSRMGFPKALLRDSRQRPFVLRILDSLDSAGIRHVVVVTGRHHDAITAIVRAGLATGESNPRIRLVRNMDPDRGQLSSIWVGMDAVVEPSTAGLLVTLVDVPLVASSTIRTVAEAWQGSRAAIVRPQVGARYGHPVVFDRVVFGELRLASLEFGARAVVRADPNRVLNVPVDDVGCLVDVDTPSDYAGLRD